MSRYSVNNSDEVLEHDVDSAYLDLKPYREDVESASIGVSDRGPRSKIVEALLLLLYVKPMKSSEISKIIGKQSKLISSYLSYWKTRGYVNYKSGYWFLTKRGEEHVRTFLESIGVPVVTPQDVVLLAHKLINEQISNTINGWVQQRSRSQAAEIQQFAVSNTGLKVGKQTLNSTQAGKLQKALDCVTKVLESKDLLEDEMAVMNLLIKHYIEWGSTYLYLDQMAEDLHLQVQELVQILRRLQTKRLVYLYNDKRFGIRVGLGKSFKLILDHCISK